MPNESGKTAVGRQSQMPFSRALEISLRSLKIRFWRSMVTAGGIFLGIAFFTVVRTQFLMQWPVPEKVDAGFFKIAGQVNGPDDYLVWTPIPVDEGVKAGMPENVIKRVAKSDGTFSLAAIVQGQLDAKRADKNLARVKREWEGLQKVQAPIAFYVAVAGGGETKADEAVKFGVPERAVDNLVLVALLRKRLDKLPADSEAPEDLKKREMLDEQISFFMRIALDEREEASASLRRLRTELTRELPKNGVTFLGSDLADLLREKPDLLPTVYSEAVLDQDITIADGVRAGVPEDIAKFLAGEGKTFKASALNDKIKDHPRWMKIWQSRARRYAIFKTAPPSSITTLGKAHAITLNQAIEYANKTTKEADLTNMMIVNADRKIKVNFDKDGKAAGDVKLQNGDNVLVLDLNTRYRMWWLVTMSLLVCAVGITNSMLMAVTERFKEIGTMKCLGALDIFVVELFMLESSMMGVVASILGWLVGFVLIVLIAGFTRGWGMVGNIEGLSVFWMFLQSIGVGLLLTIVATILPAKRAADMPPAMALRSEI